MPKLQPLSIRKLADKTDPTEQRVRMFNPDTGQHYLVDANTGEPKSWPFAGMEIIGDPPQYTTISSKLVISGEVEGWIELINPRQVHRPGGPATEPWRVTHTFTQADEVVLKTVDGDIHYVVIHQPDKYDDNEDSDDNTPVSPVAYANGETRLDWFFTLKLVNSDG